MKNEERRQIVVELRRVWKPRLFYHLPKKSGNFFWDVNGKTLLIFPNANFQGKRDFLEGSPKSPHGISE